MFVKLKLVALCGYLYILGILCTFFQQRLSAAISKSSLASKRAVILSRILEKFLHAFSRLENRVINLFVLLSFER